MTTDVPLYITELVGVLEAELRDMETVAGQLRDTITGIREIWKVPHMVPASTTGQASPPLVQSAPASPAAPTRAPEPKPSAPAAPARPPVETSQRATVSPSDHQRQLERVLKGAQTFNGSFRMAQLQRLVPDIPLTFVARYVAALVDSGSLTKSGYRAGTKYQVTGHAGPQAAVPKTPATTADDVPPVANPKLIASGVLKFLATGASYGLRELVRNLRGIAPEITEAQLEPIVLELVDQRHAMRISTESGPRFRKRAVS